MKAKLARIRKASIVVKPHVRNSHSIVTALVKWLRRRKIDTFAEARFAEAKASKEAKDANETRAHEAWGDPAGVEAHQGCKPSHSPRMPRPPDVRPRSQAARDRGASASASASGRLYQ